MFVSNYSLSYLYPIYRTGINYKIMGRKSEIGCFRKLSGVLKIWRKLCDVMKRIWCLSCFLPYWGGLYSVYTGKIVRDVFRGDAGRCDGYEVPDTWQNQTKGTEDERQVRWALLFSSHVSPVPRFWHLLRTSRCLVTCRVFLEVREVLFYPQQECGGCGCAGKGSVLCLRDLNLEGSCGGVVSDI